MVAGVDFEVPDYGEFEALAISVHGNIKAIAKKLSVTPVTIYRHFKKDPELKCIVDEAREYNSFFDLDLAEHVNRYNMTNFMNEPSIAQRAAEYTIDRKGRDRGWIKEDTREQSTNDENIRITLSLSKDNAKLRQKLQEMKSKYEPETGTEYIRSDEEAQHLVRSGEEREDLL